MTRRGVVGAALAVLGQRGRRKPAPSAPSSDLPVGIWTVVPCPGCHLDVCFLPGQRRNRCAWCKTKVVLGGLGK